MVLKSRINQYQFLIDDVMTLYFLIQYSRQGVYSFNQKILELQNFLFEDRKLFELIYTMKLDNFLIIYKNDSKNTIISYLRKKAECKLLQEIQREVMEKAAKIRKEFESKIDEIENFFVKVMKIKLDRKIDIYFLPFSLGVSFEIDGNIFYGTVYKYPDIVNLYHEILHTYLGNGKLEHAVIELLTNGELLKNIYHVQDDNIYFDGHWFLGDIKQEIKKNWSIFIKKECPLTDIFDFCAEMKNILNDRKYFYKIKEKKDNKVYLNLSEKVIFTNGAVNGLLIDDETKDIIHIESELKELLLQYCYSSEPFFPNSISPALQKNINSLIEKQIVSIDPFKINNIPLKVYRYHSINIESFVFDIINKCNYFCKHCYFYGRKKNKQENQNIFNFPVYKKMLDELKIYGLETVHIAGGEPFLAGKEKLLQFIYEAWKRENIRNIYLFTNASLLNEHYIQELTLFRDKLLIGITFHSHIEKKNDEIAGIKGDFRRKLKLLDQFKRKQVNYLVYSVYSKYNMNDFAETTKFVKSLKLPTQLKGVHSLARTNQFTSNIIERNKKIEKFLYDPFETLQKIIPNIPEILINRTKHPCFSRHISVNNNEELYACSELHLEETKIGTLKNFDFNIEKILTSSNFKNRIAMFNREEKCHHCEFRFSCFQCYAIYKHLDKYHVKTYCKYDPEKGENLTIDEILT